MNEMYSIMFKLHNFTCTWLLLEPGASPWAESDYLEAQNKGCSDDPRWAYPMPPRGSRGGAGGVSSVLFQYLRSALSWFPSHRLPKATQIRPGCCDGVLCRCAVKIVQHLPWNLQRHTSSASLHACTRHLRVLLWWSYATLRVLVLSLMMFWSFGSAVSWDCDSCPIPRC